ncbi:MAG: aminotransferase class I/II-fold pyridoxal phosphate-dependent enzyme [Anaerolineae bacterium]
MGTQFYQEKPDAASLALFGGKPAFDHTLHVGRPNIGDRERLMARINDILDRRWFTNNGPVVQAFEQAVADLVGVRHAVAMCNATIAQEITVRALGLQGEVIVPSFTFIATAHALHWQDITPVFCDVAPNSHHIDPQQVEALITPRTTAIVGVHVWGQACNVAALTSIAHQHNLKLIFDAAHALGGSYQRQMIGGFGDAEFFSFHATKFINAFEGGMVTTNNDALAEKMRHMRNFGFVGYDDVDYMGTNGKMSEVSAAMGLTSLEAIDSIIDVNRRNYTAYQTHLADIPGLSLYAYDPQEHQNYQYVIVEVDETAGTDRDTLIRILTAENVLARRYFYPGCHQMEPYRTMFPAVGARLPRTEHLTRRVMSLPTGTAVTPEDIEKICQICRFAMEHHDEIRVRL